MSKEGPTDIILSMACTPTEDYMQQIVELKKTHEFRKRLYPYTVERIWFYETAPISAITYICEISPAVIRPPQHPERGPGSVSPENSTDEPFPLPLDGIKNLEYNNYHHTFEGYDYAYPVRSCHKLLEPITLVQMKEVYGMGGPPRGMVYVPEKVRQDIKWNEQERIWSKMGQA